MLGGGCSGTRSYLRKYPDGRAWPACFVGSSVSRPRRGPRIILLEAARRPVSDKASPCRPSSDDSCLFLLVLTALRLAFIGRVELSPDEAYYQMWSERLDWGYYSKGPGVAMAIRLGTALFGPTEFGVRFLSPVFALGTSLALLVFARRLYGDGSAAWTILLLNLIPIFQAGSLLMTIDPLSVFFWSAAMLDVHGWPSNAAGSASRTGC